MRGIGLSYELLVFGNIALAASLSLAGPVLHAAAGCAYAAVSGTTCRRRLAESSVNPDDAVHSVDLWRVSSALRESSD